MFDLDTNLERIIEIEREYFKYDINQLNLLILELDDISHNLIMNYKTLEKTDKKSDFVKTFGILYKNVLTYIDKIHEMNKLNTLIESINLKCKKLDNDYIVLMKLIYFEIVVEGQLSQFMIDFIDDSFKNYINHEKVISNFIDKYGYSPRNYEPFQNIKDRDDLTELKMLIPEFLTIMEKCNLPKDIIHTIVCNYLKCKSMLK